MAVLPPPITATRRPTAIVARSSLSAAMKSSASTHAGQLLAGDAEAADAAQAHAEEDGVVVALQLGDGDVAADAHAAANLSHAALFEPGDLALSAKAGVILYSATP